MFEIKTGMFPDIIPVIFLPETENRFNLRKQNDFLLIPTLREKCPNTEISVFSPNTGKYVPEKTPYFDTFHAMLYE